MRRLKVGFSEQLPGLAVGTVRKVKTYFEFVLGNRKWLKMEKPFELRWPHKY
jgi:hypothetical protein